MTLTMGIDIGTSGVKAVAVDERGQVIASASEPYPLSAPRPQWSEQAPVDWWNGARRAVRTVTAALGSAPVVAIGLTGQMHGAVFLDAHDRIIRPAMLWNDQRTAAECAEITRRVGAERLVAITGNPALTGFQAPKIIWLRHHEPEAYARIARVLLPKDFIRLRLSGSAATDASDAAGTLLLDLRRRTWSATLLDALDLPASWFPAVFEGPEITGTLLPAVAAELGLPAGVPLVAGGGDNAAAAVGTGIVTPGVVSSSIGTSGVLFAHMAQIALDPAGRLHSFCHAVPGAWHLMAVTLAAGGALRWLRDTLAGFGGAPLSYDALVALAADTPPGAEGLIFLPYLTGERTPHLDPLARGAFIGLTSRHGAGHLVRAVLEGAVYALRDGLEIMRALGLAPQHIRATGGGAASAFWRGLQADIYGAPVETLAAEEGPAFGAALLAGVGGGVFRSIDDAVASAVRVSGVVEPDAGRHAAYEATYAIFRDGYAATRGLDERLAHTGAG